MDRAEGVLEARVVRARVHEVREAELLYAPKPLHSRRIYNRALETGELYVAVHRVLYNVHDVLLERKLINEEGLRTRRNKEGEKEAWLFSRVGETQGAVSVSEPLIVEHRPFFLFSKLLFALLAPHEES
jgi:hypothetical protein